MPHLRKTLLASASLLVLLNTTLSHAAAFQFYELGTPLNGTAGVGQAAIADDASTSYYNPAGMAELSNASVLIGTQLAIPRVNFETNSANTIPGINGGNAGLLTPGLGMFFVQGFGPRLKFGVSLTQPYGGQMDYSSHWVGRYNVQQTTFYTLDFNPAISYQVNCMLSVGAGLTLEYANLNQYVALPLGDIDGQLNVKASNYATGFNAGVLFTPCDATKIGLTYRSQIVHHLRGNIDFENISDTPSVSTKMVIPANVIASASQMLTNKLTVLGELGWSHWSSMVNTILHVDDFAIVSPENWHDTYRVGIGAQYRFLPCLLVLGGVSYDSSPTSASRRLPSLPMDRQIRIGTGVKYNLMKAVTLGLSYEYINFGDAAINHSTTIGMLAGSYPKNHASILQASLSFSC